MAVHDLEYPRLEINDPHILNDSIQARHEFQMRWVFLKAITQCQWSDPSQHTTLRSKDLLVLAVLGALELADEAM